MADLFAAFGMYPVGFYDLRDAASPVPVVSTAFRPIDPDELDRNPFRVFTSMLATADARFFSPELRARVERFLAGRQLFDPALIAEARRIASDGGADRDRAARFVAAAVAAFALSREPIDRGWYDELSRVSAVAADIAGVTTTHINHLTPRVLDIDELYRRMSMRGVTMIDAIQGPPRTDRPRRVVAADVVSGARRAAALPRCRRHGVRRHAAGALRRGRGARRRPDARRQATLRRGDGDSRSRPRCGITTSPRTDDEMAASGLAYYHGGDPTKPVVYEDFLPASAAGIFRSNLDTDTHADETADGSDYSLDWMAGADRPTHSRSVRALRESGIIMTTMQKSQLPTADDLRARVRDALAAVGSPARAR